MRKVIFFLSVYAFYISFAYSAVYRSNALGQSFESVDEIKEDGWYLSRNGESEALYYNGELQEERNKNAREERVARSDGSQRLVTYSEDGLIRDITEIDGNNELKYSLIFENGKLKGYDYSENGELLKHVEYVSFDNRLMALKGDERAIFASDFYSYTMDGEDVILRESNDGIEVLEKNEEGLFTETITKDDEELVRYYDDSMHLVSEIAPNKSIYYSYIDGTLSEIRTVSGNSESIEIYVDGKLSNTQFLENGIMSRERRVLLDGNIEDIRYLNGIARYRFLYAPDGMKLLEAEAL